MPTTIASTNIALVTGASAGIGAVYADRLARRGHDLILVSRDDARMQALATRLRAQTGRAVEVVPTDLTDRDARAPIEARLRDDPAITMLVNNAGIARVGPTVGADADALEAMVQLNTIASLRLAVAAITAFAARNRGTLINVASIIALEPERLNATYSGTKTFLLNLTLSLHNELAQTQGEGTHVRVQAVLPGATRTELWAKVGVDVDTLPADRVMSAEDVVDAALAGLDLGEVVTIPSLPDQADWDAYNTARRALAPKLSRNVPAARYRRTD